MTPNVATEEAAPNAATSGSLRGRSAVGGGPLRVLIATHSHPKLTHGGAEISADSLAEGLRAAGDDVWLFGCSRNPLTARLSVPLTQPFRNDDFLYQVPDSFDYFKFANRDPRFPAMLRELLLEVRPDIVHFHHYAHFGVEAAMLVKRTIPTAKVVLTLHEFLAICNNHGQMVKTKSHRLCEKEGLLDCSACFPLHSPRDFFLRKSYIMKFFDAVDSFVAPSRFLADRYEQWGLDRGRIAVLDNVLPAPPAIPANEDTVGPFAGSSRRRADGAGGKTRRPVRIGYFGQMSPLKGIIVLLDAARLLVDGEVTDIVIDIHGDYSNQPLDFQAVVERGLKEAGSNVRYHGPYENAQVHRLMRSVDAVVVASTWWENSPVVIEEALASGRPVLCSNIGGMAEKIRPGIDGLWFEAGDSRSLMDLLVGIADDPEILVELAATARAPVARETAVKHHKALYHALLAPGELASQSVGAEACSKGP